MYVASALFYIAAIIGFISDSDQAVIWLALGSVFMCIASSRLKNTGDRLRENEERAKRLENEIHDDEEEPAENAESEKSEETKETE